MSRPIAFFDVDKTLCDCYSGFHTTMDLIRLRIIKKRRLLQAVLYNAIGRIYLSAPVDRMYEIAIADMAGTALPDIMEIGRRTFEAKVKPTLYREGIEEIRRLKSEGYTVALISSGPYMLIKNMEAFVGADASFSNGPVIRDNILQKEVQKPLVYKEGKVLVAEKFAADQGVSLASCLFYSDSLSDLPLLEKVGHPFVVNPDRKLFRVAAARKWPVLNFQDTLGRTAPTENVATR